MALTFHTSVAKGSKLKFKKFFGLIRTFVEVTGVKLINKAFQWLCLEADLEYPKELDKIGNKYLLVTGKEEIKKIIAVQQLIKKYRIL